MKKISIILISILMLSSCTWTSKEEEKKEQVEQVEQKYWTPTETTTIPVTFIDEKEVMEVPNGMMSFPWVSDDAGGVRALDAKF